jgi:hypothetical protein
LGWETQTPREFLLYLGHEEIVICTKSSTDWDTICAASSCCQVSLVFPCPNLNPYLLSKADNFPIEFLISKEPALVLIKESKWNGSIIR